MKCAGHTSRFGITLLSWLVNAAWVVAAPDDIVAPQTPLQNPQVRNFVMDDSNFDANVFNPYGGAKQAQASLQNKLKLQIDELNQVCGLNEQQIKKMYLAASTDMKRLFDDVETVRKKYKASNQDQNAWNEIWREIQPLQLRMSAGLFGETSYFAKTVHSLLDEDQRNRYQALLAERRAYRYAARIEETVTYLDGLFPLTSPQRLALIQLLKDETKPPAVFGPNDHWVVKFQLSTLPAEKLQSVLDERQRRLMQAHLDQFRGMKQMLINQGVLPQELMDEIEDKKAARKNKREGAGQAEDQPASAELE